MKVATYAALAAIYAAFDKPGGLGFVIIKSRGGLGKTELAKRMSCFKEDNWISGTTTEAGMFEKFRKDPDGQFIVDDVEGLVSGSNAAGKKATAKSPLGEPPFRVA